MEQQINNKSKSTSDVEQSHQQENSDKDTDGSPSEKKARIEVSTCALTIKPASYEHLRKITKSVFQQKLYTTKSSPEKQIDLDETNRTHSPSKEKDHRSETVKDEVSSEVSHNAINIDILPSSQNNNVPSSLKSSHSASDATTSNDKKNEISQPVKTDSENGIIKEKEISNTPSTALENVKEKLTQNKKDEETKEDKLFTKQLKSKDPPSSPTDQPVEADVNINRYKTREFTKMLRTMIEDRMHQMEQNYMLPGITTELNAKISLLEKTNNTLEVRCSKIKAELEKALNSLKSLEKDQPKVVTRGTQTLTMTKTQVSSASTPSFSQSRMVQGQRDNMSSGMVSQVPQSQRPPAPNNLNYSYTRSHVVSTPRVTCSNSFETVSLVNQSLSPSVITRAVNPRQETPGSSVQVVYASRSNATSTSQANGQPNVSIIPKSQVIQHATQVLMKQSSNQPVDNHLTMQTHRSIVKASSPVGVDAPNTRGVANTSSTRPYHPRESRFILTTSGQLAERHLPQTLPQQPQTLPQQPQTLPQQPKTLPHQSQTIPQQSQTIPQQSQTIPQQSQSLPQQPQTLSQQPQTLLQQPQTFLHQPQTVGTQNISVSVSSRNISQAQVQPVHTGNNPQDIARQYPNLGRPPPVTVTVHPQQLYNQSVTQQALRPPPPPYENSQRIVASTGTIQYLQPAANQNQLRVLPQTGGQRLVPNRTINSTSIPPPSLQSPLNTQAPLSSQPVLGSVNQGGQVVGTVAPQVQARSQQAVEQAPVHQQTRNIPPAPPPTVSVPASVPPPVTAPPPLPQSAPLPQVAGSQAIEPQRTPPKPSISITGVQTGIVLSWNMKLDISHAKIDIYQLFAYQDTGCQPTSPSMWKKIGVVKALPLPMACTLTQFLPGSTYHFAVRAVDVNGRAGPFSDPCTITLPKKS